MMSASNHRLSSIIFYASQFYVIQKGIFMKNFVFFLAAFSTFQAFALEAGERLSQFAPIKSSAGRVLYKLPLPPGDWQVEYTGIRSAGGIRALDLRDISLILVENQILKQAIEITAQAESNDGRWTDEPCKVGPTYHTNTFGTSLWKQKCLTLQPTAFLQNNNAATTSLINKLVSQGVGYDNMGVKFTYTRYGDHQKFMVYRMFVFPSGYGLEKPSSGSVNDSPWFPARVENDPIRKAFVNAVKNYAESVVPALDAAFEEKAFLPLEKFVH
jgi:hypothetical protein